MKTTGFVGPSGTGKSHRATWVASERGIEYIIDDGLLIKENRVVAGSSAKRQGTRIASVKHALFLEDQIKNDMVAAIKRLNPDSIMIIGTSDEMVQKIVARLGLPDLSDTIYITDVANDYEIKQAVETRREQGKHVIPVPTFEIKKDFSGYFLDPLQIFKRKGKGDYQTDGEKSVVRPTFSYMGKYTISDYTIYQLVEYAMKEVDGVSKITRFRAENRPEGTYIEMDVVIYYGSQIKQLIQDIQEKVRREVEKLTALNIKTLNLTIKGVQVKTKQ